MYGGEGQEGVRGDAIEECREDFAVDEATALNAVDELVMGVTECGLETAEEAEIVLGGEADEVMFPAIAVGE